MYCKLISSKYLMQTLNNCLSYLFVVGLCWFLLRFSKISSMIMAVPLSFNVLFCVFLLLCCIILVVLPSSAQSDNKLEPTSSSVFLEIVSSSSPYASGLQPVFAKLTISQHLALPAFLSLRLSLSSNRDLQDLTTRHSRFAHLMSSIYIYIYTLYTSVYSSGGIYNFVYRQNHIEIIKYIEK